MSDLNDPRVYFAAERTLLAWNRTAIALMAFGFVIERASLMLKYLAQPDAQFNQSSLSLVVGVGFIFLGTVVALLPIAQFRFILRSLRSVEIPDNYLVQMAPMANIVVALLGLGLAASIFIANT